MGDLFDLTALPLLTASTEPVKPGILEYTIQTGE